MDPSIPVDAMVDQAQALFARRKSKLLGIAIEEEKEQRRLELELEQRILSLCNEDKNEISIEDFQRMRTDKTPAEKTGFPRSALSKIMRKGGSKGKRKNIDARCKTKSVTFAEDNDSGNEIIKTTDNDNRSNTKENNDIDKELDEKTKQTQKAHVVDDEWRWVEPTRCSRGKLTDAQITSWREEGYVIVQELLPKKLLKRVLQDAAQSFPDPSSEAAKKITDFGDGLAFPSTVDSVNELALHPQLLEAVSTLLRVPVQSIRLTQAEVWPKYGFHSDDTFNNSDQRIHCDFPNHTLVCPPPWDKPEAVEMIIYLNDVEECGGATAVVPRVGINDPAYEYPMTSMPGFGALQWRNNRQKAEEYVKSMDEKMFKFRKRHLYPREKYAKYSFGSVLLYRHDTWHRGTPLKPSCLRLVVNCTFRKAGSEWISTLHQGWAWGMYRRSMQVEKLIAKISVDQRCVLGFPGVGSSYWNHQTLEAVRRRYEPLGMDMNPYAEGIKGKEDIDVHRIVDHHGQINEIEDKESLIREKKCEKGQGRLDISEDRANASYGAHLDELYGVIEGLEQEIKVLKQQNQILL